MGPWAQLWAAAGSGDSQILWPRLVDSDDFWLISAFFLPFSRITMVSQTWSSG